MGTTFYYSAASSRLLECHGRILLRLLWRRDLCGAVRKPSFSAWEQCWEEQGGEGRELGAHGKGGEESRELSLPLFGCGLKKASVVAGWFGDSILSCMQWSNPSSHIVRGARPRFFFRFWRETATVSARVGNRRVVGLCVSRRRGGRQKHRALDTHRSADVYRFHHLPHSFGLGFPHSHFGSRFLLFLRSVWMSPKEFRHGGA